MTNSLLQLKNKNPTATKRFLKMPTTRMTVPAAKAHQASNEQENNQWQQLFQQRNWQMLLQYLKQGDYIIS